MDSHAEASVRLLHVSDVHFGVHDPRAIEAVAGFAQQMAVDALVAAGDITQNGRTREFQAARGWFEKLGVRCIIVPGNHDTPALHRAHRLPARLVSPFGAYQRHLDSFDAVGRLVELGGGLVRLSGINTARGVQGRLNWADGVISRTALDQALDLLGPGPRDCWRVLVCHHPLHEPAHSMIAVDTKRGSEALRKCAVHGVDVVLTGHIHDAFAHPLQIAGRRIAQMGSGTLSTRTRATPPSFCVISFSEQRVVQDIVQVRDELEIRRNYDSLLHEAEGLRLCGPPILGR